MIVVVAGAAGQTGAAVVREALDRELDVVALARRPERVLVDPRVHAVAADVLAAGDWQQSFDGADAVVSALGDGARRDDTRLYSAGTTNLLTAMATFAVPRIAVVSAAPVGPTHSRPVLERRVVYPVLWRFLGGSYRDMSRMEDLVRRSGVGWTILRPPLLTNRRPRHSYRASTDGPVRGGFQIPRADLAVALLDAVLTARFVNAVVEVAA